MTKETRIDEQFKSFPEALTFAGQHVPKDEGMSLREALITIKRIHGELWMVRVELTEEPGDTEAGG